MNCRYKLTERVLVPCLHDLPRGGLWPFLCFAYVGGAIEQICKISLIFVFHQVRLACQNIQEYQGVKMGWEVVVEEDGEEEETKQKTVCFELIFCRFRPKI